MRLHHLVFAPAAVAILLAGCERKAEEAAPPPAAQAPASTPAAPASPAPVIEGFSHQAGFDASGYLMPQAEVRVGSYRLTHVGLGSPSDFTQWEKGDHSSTFGPILLEFEDTSSPVQTNEMGGETHTVSARVLPVAYAFGPDGVSFRGQDPKLGEVILTGKFDVAALDAARAEGSGSQAVLTGELRVGGGAPRPVSFLYWVGD